jgi:MFS family permease
VATENVLESLKTRRMSPMQYVTVIVGLALVVLDGYDIAITSFASPFIAAGLHINPTRLGLVGSGALVGLFIGTVVIAPFGDKIGRRNTAIFGAVLVAAGMGISTYASTFGLLAFGRLVAGAGIGTLIASVAVIFSEFVSSKAYAVVMALYAAAIPLGTLIGSQWIGPVVAKHGWHVAFGLGTVAALACIPLTVFLLPESLAYLAISRKADALKRFNKTLRRVGIAPVPELPRAENLIPVKTPVTVVLKGSLLRSTVLSTVGYFLFMLAFYFATNWAPNYMAAVTHNPLTAPHLMTWYSVGGIIGVALFAVLAQRINLALATAVLLVASAVLLGVFGHAATVQVAPYLAIAALSFFLSAATGGFYSIVPRLYPEKARSTGYGLVIGIGRVGGIVAPTLGGYFFTDKVDPQLTFWVFAIPLVLSAVVVLALRADKRSPAGDEAAVTAPAVATTQG